MKVYVVYVWDYMASSMGQYAVGSVHASEASARLAVLSAGARAYFCSFELQD